MRRLNHVVFLLKESLHPTGSNPVACVNKLKDTVFKTEIKILMSSRVYYIMELVQPSSKSESMTLLLGVYIAYTYRCPHHPACDPSHHTGRFGHWGWRVVRCCRCHWSARCHLEHIHVVTLYLQLLILLLCTDDRVSAVNNNPLLISYHSFLPYIVT